MHALTSSIFFRATFFSILRSRNNMTARDEVSLGCTCFNLRKVARIVTRLYDQHLAATGLTTAQYSLLNTVAHEAAPISAIAARMSTERTTITRNLKALVEAGWVVLGAGEDSRQRIAAITEEGRAVMRAARHAWREAQTELENTLGLETVGRLHADLDAALIRLTPLLEDRKHAEAE
jgi:DNA-binding MarR family transcriptional regulator